MIKHCIAIHDLCSYAKSSLTVVIPVLETLGVEVFPLPTAVLSSQTDGFKNLYIKDLTKELDNILDVWDKEEIKADCIYTGFLASAEQVKIVKRVIKSQKENNPLIVVDPVLGDDLKLYSSTDPSLIKEMQELISEADIICPNVTEAAILLGLTPKKYYSEKEIDEMLKSLVKLGPRKVVITSVLVENSDELKTCFIEDNELGEYGVHKVDYAYPGSGDLFASIMIGSLFKGYSLSYACIFASNICAKVLKQTKKLGYSRKHGVSIASIIPALNELN